MKTKTVIAIRPGECCIDGQPGEIFAPLELSISALRHASALGQVTVYHDRSIYDIPESQVEYLVLSEDGEYVLETFTPAEVAARNRYREDQRVRVVTRE